MVLMPRRTSRLLMPPGARPFGRACGRRKALLALATVVLTLPATSTAAPWEFEPRVALGQIWTDNIALAADGLEESEWVTELRPGFTLETDGPRASVNIDYDLQALWYADNSDLDDTYHQLNGNADFVLAPDSLFLDTFARFEQQNVDTRGLISSSNLFDTENRTDVFVFGTSPYHLGRWGSWGESEVRYQQQGVRYSNTDPSTAPPDDSDSSAIFASLGSPAAAPGYSWRASGSYNRTDFDVAREFEYARVALDMGVPVSLRTRLTATAGQESDVEEDPSIGGLDSWFWYVGFAWQPSALQSLEARVGQRFFGTAWEVHWRRRGSRGELSVDYTEEPTTSAGVLGDDGIFAPGVEAGGVGSLDARVFLQKRLAGTANYELARSTIRAQVYADRREYQDATSETEDLYGALLSYVWDFATRTRFDATIDWSQSDLASDGHDHGRFSVSITRDFTPTLNGVLRVGHFLRNSDIDGDYNSNQASVFIEARF